MTYRCAECDTVFAVWRQARAHFETMHDTPIPDPDEVRE